MYSNGYAVEDFYNKYPFPQRNESYIRTKSIQLKDLFHKLGIIDTLPHKPLILDAGCGTGTATNSLALAFPEAKVIGINVSQRSIEYAETQAKNMKLSNVEYFVADLFNLPKNVSLSYYDLI
jgi:tRNA G46 methylase TrmB